MQFNVDEEAILSLWDGVRRELEELEVPERLSHGRLQVARTLFLSVVAYLGEHVLTGVASTAGGASEATLRIALRGSFERDFARETLRILDFVVGHELTSDEEAVH